ncbi:large conductance mechanosensitive channel protein MscL [Croceicoccus gelatinilyticus]|uniref:large conductance mechanosensitive channel protein MscL n=1 Tax=Croceicoccus gelatinilyticus TaxID=2835536 RepID=UPI001BCA6C3D|nr:large conductance mechanosensitive channel protein MscL [Croceicoccus gelatinilyticus]MBS7670894.1 large conductance mechanosensitive channel protein MscL [Croceicoccus gelatinilyticus]
MMAEFKKFIARGNVLDLAVGVVIGAAFGKITTSLTESILMPIIGAVFGSVDFSNKFILLGSVPEGYDGALDNYAALKEAGVPMIGYGDLITQILNFLIIAFALFMIVRGVNRMMDAMEEEKKAAEETAKAEAVPTDPTLDTLKEILAELKKKP